MLKHRIIVYWGKKLGAPSLHKEKTIDLSVVFMIREGEM